jgi:hypothetical protein
MTGTVIDRPAPADLITNSAKEKPAMRSMIAKLGFAVCGLALVGLGLYDVGMTVLWDGDFPLTVRVMAAGDQPIRRVTALAIASEDLLPPPEYDSEEDWFLRKRQTVIEPFAGQPFNVLVTCGGNQSGLGRDRSYGQNRTLVVWVEFVDGRKARVCKPIPDGRRLRQLDVDIPMQ